MTFTRKNRKPCFKCGTTDLEKKIPQEYQDGKPCWKESCYKCWNGNDER